MTKGFEFFRAFERKKKLDEFERTLDSWFDFSRPKEFKYCFYETDFDSIYKKLNDLKETNKKKCELIVTIGYSKQIVFPADFNIIDEKNGFLKIIRQPGDATEEEYIRFRPKKLIARLTPLTNQDCVLIASDKGESYLDETNDFCVEHNGIYAPFDKGKELFDYYNLVYNVFKQSTPILFFPQVSDFSNKKKRASLLRELWHDIRSDSKKYKLFL